MRLGSKLGFFAAALFLALPAPAAGLITFSLTDGAITTAPGGIYQPTECQDTATYACVIFDGTIAFTTEQNYYAEDIEITMDPSNPDGGADVVGNDNYFFSTAGPPGTYGPDGVASGSYTGGLFEVDVPVGVPLGVYNGNATLVATDDDGDSISQTVDFAVAVAPEPGMSALMLAGLASLAAVGRRFRRK